MWLENIVLNPDVDNNFWHIGTTDCFWDSEPTLWQLGSFSSVLVLTHRVIFLSKASDLENLGQILCCSVNYWVPDWWIFLCEQSLCINCSMTESFQKCIWCPIVSTGICQASKLVWEILSLRTCYCANSTRDPWVKFHSYVHPYKWWLHTQLQCQIPISYKVMVDWIEDQLYLFALMTTTLAFLWFWKANNILKLL